MILRCRVGSSETRLIGPTALRRRPVRSLSCASMNVRSRGLPHVISPCDNLERIVGKRPLQLERFLGWRIHPVVDLLPRRQNDGHCFRVDHPDLLVRLGCQKREDVICGFAFLHFPDGGTARPDAGKDSQGLGVVPPGVGIGAELTHSTTAGASTIIMKMRPSLLTVMSWAGLSRVSAESTSGLGNRTFISLSPSRRGSVASCSPSASAT